MRRSRLLRAVAFCSGVLVSWSPAAAAGPVDAPLFPAPNRPVATIVSPAYSNETARDRHGEAERVMNRLRILAGMRVVDIGAGDGYYTVRLARRLGRAMPIYAEDVKAEYVERLESRLKREGISGVTLIRGEPGDPKLPQAAIDVAILAHVYHEIENPYEFLYRLRPSLAPEARLAIVEVDKATQDHGTPPALLRCELAAVGYREIDFMSLAPADGYLAVFVPPDALPRVEAIRPCTP
jgi:SAM-dependent methyltransferase